MGLSNVILGIQTDLVTCLTALGATSLAGVTFRTGEKELARLDAPPRITWVRVPGVYEPGEQGRGRDPRSTARILRTHAAHVDAYVWAIPNPANGNDDSDCELLAHTLVASAYRETHGCFEALGDLWPQPAWLTRGFLNVVSFRFRIPVVDVTPTSIALAGPPVTMPFDESMTPIPPGTLQAPGDE